MQVLSVVKNPQEAHYEKIHDDYVAHYFDPTSREYRRRYIFETLFAGVDLDGKRVAELASSVGTNSLLLRERFPGIRLEGFDLSKQACLDYERNVGAPAHVVDLTRTAEIAPTFDAAFIVGGLHHCVNDLPTTMRNIAGMLKPGATLHWYEPNASFLLQKIRDLWYRADKFFDAASERALTEDELIGAAADWFVPGQTLYLGGPAYFLVLNSLIFRVPLRAKATLAPLLFALENGWSRVPGSLAHPVIAGIWRRTDTAIL